ncbi:MAG: type II secretion system F family protein [Pirellulaceae bacterium]|jgi:tight adherence protein B|nr:type II secretion system F family protein [Pirellulaceae bacterium]
MLTVVVIVASFLGVAALVGGVAILFRSDETSAVEERLEILAGTKSPALARGGDPESSLLSSPLDETRGMIEKLVSRVGNLRRLLEQADAPLDPSRFILISAGLAGGGAIACILVPSIPAVLAPVVAPVLGATPLLWVLLRRRKRLRKFGQQMPEALELISRALRAGHSLASGINLVSEEMNEPIANEFRRCYEAQNLGIPLDEALEDMCERVPNLDLRFFVTAIVLQRQTGGDLAEILDKIGSLIRERFKIWGQIQALTGEGRLSGIVLLALPPALFVVMYYLNPDYCMVLFTDPLGHKMLAAAVVMQIIGAIVIKKIISIKV